MRSDQPNVPAGSVQVNIQLIKHIFWSTFHIQKKKKKKWITPKILKLTTLLAVPPKYIYERPRPNL